MKTEAKELVIGTRYWLDSVCDVSGVYVGDHPKTGLPYFDEIEGNKGEYLLTDKGELPLVSKRGFYVYQEEAKSE